MSIREGRQGRNASHNGHGLPQHINLVGYQIHRVFMGVGLPCKAKMELGGSRGHLGRAQFKKSFEHTKLQFLLQSCVEDDIDV